ncbi:hypothetical protein U1Q18_029377, partial [Sarracenia purpurea var. burkii]
MMSEEKKVMMRWRHSAFFKSVSSCFYASGDRKKVKGSKASSAAGPEETMVAAAKHFSSTHKVRLDH